MLNAFLWGLVASSSLLLGGLLGLKFKFGKRTLGIIMAFGAGTLISAIAYEMILDGIRIAAGTGAIALGFLIGAATFFLLDKWIDRIGAGNRKEIDATHESNLVFPLVLAIVLDGVPETAVIGLSILDGGTVSLAMLFAVFLSNLPEAIASTSGMKAGGWNGTKVMLLWLIIAVVCATAAGVGYQLLAEAAESWLAFMKAFAAGAIMMMLANTMMPEAFNHGGKLAGVFTVLGFAMSVTVALLEAT
jgi:ZIP family zinc transporter